MRSIRSVGLALLLGSTTLTSLAAADEPAAPKPPPAVTPKPAPLRALTATAPPPEEALVGRARDLLTRARVLEETASSDERLVTDLTKALPALRLAAKAARERATRAESAGRPDAEVLVIRAEELEAELAVGEVEVVVRRHAAESTRRLARELRALAVRSVKDPTPSAEPTLPCDPPYRYTADGRKLYRVECF